MRRTVEKTIISVIVLLLMIMMPDTSLLGGIVTAVNDGTQRGPKMDHLQFKFYQGQTALFTALLNNEIDLMSWPLTNVQYAALLGNSDFQLVPYCDFGEYDIAFNNNATDPSHTADSKAMNCTEFRQAMSCLIDKDGLIAGPSLAGFGTRIDTPIARPAQENWINLNVSKYDSNGNALNNYPWDYNETHALQILWDNDWYNHTTYSTLASLLAAPTPIPQDAEHGCVYPPGHPRAGQLIDQIVAYIRSDHLPRKTAGEALINEMTKYGIPNTGTTHEGPSQSVCYTPVFIDRDYDFYTAGWNLYRFPTHFYSLYTPDNIYPGGANMYMIDDANLTYHATLEYLNATSVDQAISEARICQEIIVEQAMFTPLYTAKSFNAYRKGMLGVVAPKCSGMAGSIQNGQAGLDYLMLNILNQNYPAANTIRCGTIDPPYSINPLFSLYQWEYAIVERMFTSYMNINPYKPAVPKKSPVGGDTPWMAYDWNYQLSDFTGGGGLGNPNISYTNCANITLWFRHDITWQDGVPFTVEDLNYTIYLTAAYGDSWGWSDMRRVVNFVQLDNWTCSLYFDIPSFWTLYTTNYMIVPKHICEKIDIPPDAASGGSTTGHHGEWPGADALSSEVHAPLNWPITPEETWVGTGMWTYQQGTYVNGVGGGITLDANRNFFIYTPPTGEINFDYYWNPGPPPQNGKYQVDIRDFVSVYRALGSVGNPPSSNWDSACDIAPPACLVNDYDYAAASTGFGVQWGYAGWTPPTTYELNITATPGGTTSPAPGNYTFGSGFKPVVTANSDADYVLANWELDGINVGSDNPYIVVMDQAHVLKPIFAPVGSVVLYTAPQEVQVTHGTSFSVDVIVQDVTDLYAFDVYVHFDPNLLQVTNITEGSFLRSHGETYNLTDVNQTAGYLHYVVTLLTAETGVNGSGTLFTATFVGDLVNNGTSTLSFESSELSDSNANLIPYASQEGTVNVTALTLVTQTVTVNQTEYTVELTSNSTIPGGSQFLVDVSNKTVSVNVTGMSGSMGFCNLTLPKAVMNGTFAVRINETAVAYTMTENATHYMLYFTYAQSFERVQVLLTIQGDINGDRQVILADLVLLANAYNSVPGSPKWDARCDLNRDNRVSLQDLVLLAKNYGKTYT